VRAVVEATLRSKPAMLRTGARVPWPRAQGVSEATSVGSGKRHG